MCQLVVRLAQDPRVQGEARIRIFFGPRLREWHRQSSLIATPGAPSDVVLGQRDPNPIVDIGFPRSIAGDVSARALGKAMGVQYKLEPLDAEPFWHGYGDKCSDAKLTIGMWRLPITDVHGTQALIPFYITQGDGLLLLGNEIGHKSNILGPQNKILIPKGVRDLSDKDLTLMTFDEPISSDESEGVRTYLFVVPSKMNTFKSWFSMHTSFAGTQQSSHPLGDLTKEPTAAKFAKNLHMYSHLCPDDMKTLCKTAGVLTGVLSKALDESFARCTSCQSRGRPLQSRKI